MKNIFHLTSAHSRYDTRIFLKECSTLSKNGFNTLLFVSDQIDNEKINNVIIKNLNYKRNKSRLIKTIFFYLNFLKVLKKKHPDIIHFHDPELIFLGALLKKKGYRVVYDMHENTHLQILQKKFSPIFLLKLISIVFFFLEKKISGYFDGLIFATNAIKKSHSNFSGKNRIINNFPIIDDLNHYPKKRTNSREIIYVGGINRVRGIIPLVNSLHKSNFKLNLVGNFLESDLHEKLLKLDGWKNVIYHGFCDRKKIDKLMSRSIAGIVTFMSAPNHIESQPNKLFEYMSSGLPVIASNFPLWIDIIEKNKCGICVDPQDSNEINLAIKKIFNDKFIAMEFSKNGREAITKKYNWKREESKLLNFYKELF